MSCKCKNCIHKVDKSKQIGNTLYMWDICLRNGKTISWLALYADRECPYFEVKQ